MFDFDAYLERIRLDGPSDLASIHRAHACAIPFENLDPHAGVPVSLGVDALHTKLVTSRRGGYCFEQNLLLKAALEARGAKVETLLARVRWGAPPGVLRPQGHLVLKVEIDGAVWHADVGFGGGTLLEPIPFGPGGPYEQSGWLFRVVQEGTDLVLQSEAENQWSDVYVFAPEPVPPIDLEVSNWFTCSHPASPFVTGLLISTKRQDGTRIRLSDWGDLALVVATPNDRTVTPVERDAIPVILGEQFDLPGFALDAKRRISPTPGELHPPT
jgi:N-hydroxyarylamine O-acetyltransferase